MSANGKVVNIFWLKLVQIILKNLIRAAKVISRFVITKNMLKGVEGSKEIIPVYKTKPVNTT